LAHDIDQEILNAVLKGTFVQFIMQSMTITVLSVECDNVTITTYK